MQDRDERIDTLACQICKAAWGDCVCAPHGAAGSAYAGNLATHCGKALRAAEVILDMLAPENGEAPAGHIAQGMALIGLRP